MLVLVRHGRTEWNAAGRFQGWADVELDPVGREQSAACAAALAAMLTGPVRVMSSDLRRAVQTAEAVAGALGVAFSVSESLRELDVGAWQGLTSAEAAAAHPEEYARWSAGEEVAAGGGETCAAAGRRVAKALVELVDGTPPGTHVVAVGHGRSLQWAMECLAGDGLIELSGPAPHLPNAGYVCVTDWRA